MPSRPADATTPLSEMVRRRAREMHVSLLEIASRSGLSRSHLYKLMDGETRDPSVQTLERLARALQVAPIALYRNFLSNLSSLRQESGRRTSWRAINNPRDEIAFCADVTMPDHTPVFPRERFFKVWSVQNIGQTRWSQRFISRVDTELVIARRSESGALTPLLNAFLGSLSDREAMSEVMPGQVATIKVEFEAPDEACSVASVWRVVDRDLRPVYPPDFFLQVIVTVIDD